MEAEQVYEEARSLMAERRFAEGLEKMRALVDANPDDPDIQMHYGEALIAAGQPSLAVWPLSRAMRDPDHLVPAGLLLARAQVWAGSAADAIEYGACPGDELFIRWLEGDSYAATAQITSTILVDLAPPPAKPSSPFEQRDHAEAMQRWSVAARAFRRQRHEVAQLLRELSPETAEASDVWGGIHKADELLANTPAGAQPVLLLATDFIDNVDRVGPFSLHGAAVRVIVYEADDPTEARARRAEWGERLLESDAASVEFRDVSESAVDILVELSSATY